MKSILFPIVLLFTMNPWASVAHSQSGAQKIPLLNLAMTLVKSEGRLQGHSQIMDDIGQSDEDMANRFAIAALANVVTATENPQPYLLPDSANAKFDDVTRVFNTYLDFRKRTGAAVPTFANHNGGFEAYASRMLQWSGNPDSLEIEINNSLILFCGVLQEFPSEKSKILEATADLVLHLKRSPSSKYVAAMLYYFAGKASGNDAIREAYERKAVFAMEKQISSPPTYNSARWLQLRRIAGQTLADWEPAVGRPDKLPGGRWNDFEYSFADFLSPAPGSIRLFDDSMPGPLLDFMNEQVNYDLVEQGKVLANQEFVNPSMDPGSVKSNVMFNSYAIGIIAILLISIAVIWIKFSKAEKEFKDREG